MSLPVLRVLCGHSYAEEKRDALEKLAAMIERILNPFPSNVETLGEHRAKAQA